MGDKKVIISVVLFILIVLGMFGYSAYRSSSLDVTDAVTNDLAVEQSDDKYSDVQRIDAKHFYIDGVHTIAGEISLPTPCDLLETEARVQESMPETIVVDFSVVNNAEFCAQAVTAQRFMVSAPASEGATFTALFNNRAVDLNLIPAASGETPDEFELFIKG